MRGDYTPIWRGGVRVAFSLFFTVIVGVSPAIAQTASNWNAELSGAADQENRYGRSALILKIAKEIWEKDKGSFAVEVDNLDVTSLASATSEDITYRPVETLANGKHTLRLFEVTSSGEQIKRGEWSFDVYSDPAVAPEDGKTISIAGDNSIEISQRLFDRNVETTTRNTTISGAGHNSIEWTGNNWKFQGKGNYFIESEDQLSLTGNEIDLGEYSASFHYQGDQFATQATLGHQDIGLETLALSAFRRRGVSLSVTTLEDRLKITGFSLSSESIVGADDFSGMRDDSGHVTGGAVTAKPYWTENAKLELTGLFFDSEGGESNFGVGGGFLASSAPKGTGGAFVADSYWVEDRLRVRGEYAFSNMDLDGIGTLDKESAHANSANFEYVVIKDDGSSDIPVSLSIGGKWERVDTYFYSLANPGLATDRDSYSVFANMYAGGLSLNSLGFVEFNNVDDQEDIATDQVSSFAVDGNYSFSIERETPDDLAWLGTPYIGFGGNFINADRDKTPTGYLGWDTNNKSMNYYLSVGTSYERWNWQLGYNTSKFEDDTDISEDTVNEMIDLSAHWAVSDRLSLSSGLQFNKYLLKDTDERSYNVTGNFGLQAQIIPDTLYTIIDYNMNLSSGSGEVPDRHLFTGEVEWTVIPVETNKPGVALAFRGAMEKEHGNDGSSLDDTKYEGFFVLRIKAPIKY